MRFLSKILAAILVSLSLHSLAATDPAQRTLRPAQQAAASAQARAAAVYKELLRGSPAHGAELALFLNQMPKGGDLHHHYSGAIYAETYLDALNALGYCVYSADIPELQVQRLRVETRPFSDLPAAAQAACKKQSQITDDQMLYRDILSTWSDKDYNSHARALPPDAQFFNTFGYFGPVSGYAVHQGLLDLKARAVAENLQYLETMLKGAPALGLGAIGARLDALGSHSPPEEVDAALDEAFHYLQADDEARTAIAAYVRSIQEAAQGLDDDHFTVRFQSYVSRNSTPARTFGGLYAAFAAASTSPWLVGVNFVGPENGTVAMRDYRLHMRMMGFLKRQFPQVRLSLHAGELSMGMVPPEGLRDHIHDAIELAGAQRIGHGVDIAYEAQADALLRRMAKEGRAVEINLTSNDFILGVHAEQHPLPLYRRFGVPFVISTDDAGVSRSSLSQEYLLYVTRYRPDYAELKATVYRSIQYAFLDASLRARELQRLARAFDRFERQVANWPVAR